MMCQEKTRRLPAIDEDEESGGPAPSGRVIVGQRDHWSVKDVFWLFSGSEGGEG